MPNWCNNVLRIAHTDPAMMTRANEAFAKGKLLNEFVPCPDELWDEESSSYGGDNAAEKDALRESLTAKYGYKNWYDWCVANWGTKWDVGGDETECDVHDAHNATMTFDSAWAPPTDAYRKMEELGFEIEAYYYEPGMQFAGIYEGGFDDFYESWGNAENCREQLPEVLDEMFAISENQEMWEQDEETADE